ncbi:MAG TPA: nitroreductase family deazaflavin-dependent oxidoreductase [Solirubrobacteraceae bacterium]|jgi:deazaflavin-dependent oxidoreductase (nitroreductase family)|nr:nitroreductase family deazaflavin-dependent oxidoreductase [Solirubrobacteraceae bacterium]
MAPAGPNRFQRAMRSSGGTRAGSWLYIRAQDQLDEPIFRMTRGRHTMTSLLAGLPVGMLRTTGARSGRPRQSPLLIYPTSAGQMVIASNYGQARQPAWYHNLIAHPEATLSLQGTDHRVRARRLEGETRSRIWREALETYPGLKAYERWAAGRDIPLLLLEPVS